MSEKEVSPLYDGAEASSSLKTSMPPPAPSPPSPPPVPDCVEYGFVGDEEETTSLSTVRGASVLHQDVEAQEDFSVDATPSSEDRQARTLRRRMILAAAVASFAVVAVIVGVIVVTTKRKSAGSAPPAEGFSTPAGGGGNATTTTPTADGIGGPAAAVAVPPAPSDLEVLCSSPSTTAAAGDTGGRSKCDDACFKASCCLTTCYETNEDTCEQYSVCWTGNDNDVTDSDEDDSSGPTATTPTVIMDQNVRDVCDRERIENGDIDARMDCEDLCESRQCCYTRGAGNCYRDNPTWCSEYAPCAVLQLDPSDNTGKPEYDGLNEMLDLASDYSGDYSAVQETNETEVVDGNPSTGEVDDINHNGENDTEKLNDAVKNACSPDNMDLVAGRSTCVSICIQRRCCYVPSGSSGGEDAGACPENDEERDAFCDGFDLCLALPSPEDPDQENDSPDIDDAQGGGPPQERPPVQGPAFGVTTAALHKPGGHAISGAEAIPEVDLKCTKDKVSANPEGFDACQAICDKRKCCFADGEDSCFDQQPVLCNEYLACTVLQEVAGGPTVPPPPPAAESQSGGEDLGLGSVDNTTDPTASDEDEADLEALNQALEDLHHDSSLPTKTVTEACSEANVRFNRHECVEACSPGECCFTTEEEDNCSTEYKEWCVAYDSCIILNADHEDSEDAVPQNDLEVVCSHENLASLDGWMECSMMCESMECCAGDSSCREGVGWCDNYHICQEASSFELIDSNGATSATSQSSVDVVSPSDVQAACKRENVKFDRTSCASLCSEKMCCFETGIGNCAGDSDQECYNFFPCSILREDLTSKEDVNTLADPDLLSHSAEAPANFEAICSEENINTEIGFQECHNACIPASCCADVSSFCDMDMCVAFDLCHRVWMADYNDFPTDDVPPGEEAPHYADDDNVGYDDYYQP